MPAARVTAEPQRPARSTAQPELSVVILCYRAEDFVPVFVTRMQEALARRGLDYELVLVANYHAQDEQPDRTPAIAAELARGDARITVVAQPKQGMMGWDMRAGMAAASGEAVAVIDGDGQIPADDVVAVYDRLRQGRFDMVNTYRTKRYDGFTRRFVSDAYNLMLRLLFPRVKVRDANSKPKVFTREAFQRLTLESSGWFIDAEMVIQASALGFRIGEVPMVFYWNERRQSFVRPGAILEFAVGLVRYRFKRWGTHGRR